MKTLLIIAAIVEATAGLALMIVPDVFVRMLLGAEISDASIALGRVAGAGLFALAIACWPTNDPTRDDGPACRAMLIYNALAAAYLIYLGIRGDWVGPLLWPAAVLHAVITIALARHWRMLRK